MECQLIEFPSGTTAVVFVHITMYYIVVISTYGVLGSISNESRGRTQPGLLVGRHQGLFSCAGLIEECTKKSSNAFCAGDCRTCNMYRVGTEYPHSVHTPYSYSDALVVCDCT